MVSRLVQCVGESLLVLRVVQDTVLFGLAWALKVDQGCSVVQVCMGLFRVVCVFGQT